MSGPLEGVTIIEMAGLGPCPCAGTLLSDAGATVIRVQGRRKSALNSPIDESRDPYSRGREIVTLDLKNPRGIEAMCRLIDSADALIEGYRPGVMERLGLGPDVCLKRRPRLVYGRMTGWGQDGPLAQAPGHDINYIALTGVLHAIGPAEAPVVPLNLIGDYGGGGVMLAFGIASALLHAARTGKGQVVDTAITDGAAFLMAPFFARAAAGTWRDQRESNAADGGAPFYNLYPCKDGEFIAAGPLEPKFWEAFLRLIGLEGDAELAQRGDASKWPALRRRLQDHFATRTRDEWCAILEGSDACVSPVLSMKEAAQHPHNLARGTFVETDGIPAPGCVPRFSLAERPAHREPVSATERVLIELGFSHADIAEMRREGVVDPD
jgi:alpha-methylacyl-CoA racemase